MEQIINNPGLEDVGENIFMLLSLKDLAKCQLVSRSFNGFLEKPMFWLKKWIQRGLSKKNQKDWIAAINETKDKELIKIVLLYFKKILKKRNFMDVPCFIDRRRQSMRFLQRNQKSLEKHYHQAFEDKDMGSLQILAALMENVNVPFPSESSRFLKSFAGWRPTQVAAYLNWPQILNVLAPLSDNLNDPYPDNNVGLTPMFDAVSRGHAEIVEVLAPLLANPNTPPVNNHTPFGRAAKNGHLNVVKILTPYVDDLNASQVIMNSGDRIMSAMQIAATEGHLEVINFLAQFVDPTAPPSATTEGKAPIFYAIIERQSEAVKLLANLSKHLPTPLFGSLTPIGLAEEIGAEEIVTVLKTVEKAH